MTRLILSFERPPNQKIRASLPRLLLFMNLPCGREFDRPAKFIENFPGSHSGKRISPSLSKLLPSPVPGCRVNHASGGEDRCVFVEIEDIAGFEAQALAHHQWDGDLAFAGKRRFHGIKVRRICKEIK